MKRFALALVLFTGMSGCNRPAQPVLVTPVAPANKGVEVHAPGVDVTTGPGGVDVKAPGTSVQVEK
jgi:hypothetical protein